MPTRVQKLRDILIRYLASHPGARAQVLQETAGRHRAPCTIQAIYQSLRRLEGEGVVLHERGRYFIRAAWLQEMEILVEQARAGWAQAQALACFDPASSRGDRWVLSDLGKVDDLWVQLMLVLFEHTGDTEMYTWLPHPWFNLIHYEQELKFQALLRSKGRTMRMLIGGRTFLDRLSVSQWPGDVYQGSFSQRLRSGPPDRYLSLIGDFVLQITFPRDLVSALDRIYGRVKSLQELRTGQLVELVRTKWRIGMSLRRAPRVTAQWKRQLWRSFDPPQT